MNRDDNEEQDLKQNIWKIIQILILTHKKFSNQIDKIFTL